MSKPEEKQVAQAEIDDKKTTEANQAAAQLKKEESKADTKQDAQIQEKSKTEEKQASKEVKKDEEKKKGGDDEPKIAEETTAKTSSPLKKLTTMSHKIDPPVPYQPVLDDPKIDKAQFSKWIQDLRSQDLKKMKAARDAISALNFIQVYQDAKKANNEEKIKAIEDVKFRLEFTECKVLYHLGDYKTCLDLVETRAKQIEEAYPSLVDIGTPSTEIKQKQANGLTKEDFEFDMDNYKVKEITAISGIQERISYMYLKYKLLEARIQKAVGMNHVATDICLQIMIYVKTFYDIQEPSKFWLAAVKAAKIQSTQLCNAKEYDSALKILMNVGEKVTKKVIEHFLPVSDEDVEPEKTLQDNYYSFNFRRIMAQYNIYFMGYADAEVLLRTLLRDQLDHASLLKKSDEKDDAPQTKVVGKVLEAIDQSKMNLDKLYPAGEESMYSVRGLPLYKINETILLLAEISAFKQRREDAIELYKFVQNATVKIYGTDLCVQNTYLLQLMAEAEHKATTERSNKPLKLAVEYGQKAVELFEKILDASPEKDVNNFLFSLRLQALGDFQRDMQQYEITEKTYMRCQTMMGNMFGEDHPAIIPYNSNLVTCYSSWKEKKTEMMDRMRQIIQRNMDIANKIFGEQKSIHILYHLSSNLINKIALGEINSNQEANPFIKKMREIIEFYHCGDKSMLINQLFFQIQLLYAQILQTSMAARQEDSVDLLRVVSEIYSYVLTSQVKYCRYNMKHPFLEQTYMNVAIFNRSLKKFSESLMTWKRLEELQKDLYGDRSSMLLFTWKNIGTCYLGIGQSDQALKYFNDCITLLEELPLDDDKQEIKKKDKNEILSLKQNLYLTYATDRKFEKALEMAENVIEMTSELHGPKSKKLSAKFYQKATCQLQTGSKDDSIESIKKAIDLFEHPEEKEVSQEEKEGFVEMKLGQPSEEQLSFNRIQYQNFLASVLYMIGQNWDGVVEESEKGMKLCQDFKCVELKGEADKQGKEFANIKLKAMARKQNMNALDLRQQINQDNAAANKDETNPDAIAISKNGVYVQTAAAYLLTTAAVLGYLVYQNRRSNIQLDIGRI